MDIKNFSLGLLRHLKFFIVVLSGCLYDVIRYVRHSGRYGAGKEKFEYRAVKIYHRMEKSLSFTSRKPGAGQEAIVSLYDLYKKSENMFSPAGTFHGRIGLLVAKKFLLSDQSLTSVGANIVSYFTNDSIKNYEGSATKRVSIEQCQLGSLDNPEQFFFSRHSVRDFKDTPLGYELLQRVVRLASKSPSVCNRQAWSVYFLDDRKQIDNALRFQNGNKGFGHNVPGLLIVCSDLRAFDTASERYQSWIDGGIFAMSICYALHSLGIASCFLNWSKNPSDDLRFRAEFGIPSHESIITFMAVGYPEDSILVCESARRPISEILKKL